MRIAFYAPMKPPDHPVPSGDREMARLLQAALTRAGHSVELACRFRSFDGSGDGVRQRRLGIVGRTLARALIRRYRRRPHERRPQLWFTYHLYHKAPDWLGPMVAGELGIPYVAAEASHAPKQEKGPWVHGFRAAKAAIGGADLIVGLNRADTPCVRPLLKEPSRYLPLRPFVDLAHMRGLHASALSARGALARACGFATDTPLLLTVAMMRWGNKLSSYRVLAAALSRLLDRHWRLLIAGDGPARREVREAMARLGDRVVWLGEQKKDTIERLYRAADLYVWPAIGEAYGMTLLEAEAAGLPVVAAATGGVADVVAHGRSGLLISPGDAGAFAAAVRRLLEDSRFRRRLGHGARDLVFRHHRLETAAATLGSALEAVLRRREQESSP